MPHSTKRAPIIAFSALVILLSTSTAITMQSAVIEASVTEVSKLIDVNGSLNWSETLPGHEYSSQLTISWAIPNNALKGLSSNEVVVYVKTAVSASSQLYFKQEGKPVDEVYFNLTCLNTKGSCSEGSVLSKKIEVYSQLTYGGNVSTSNAVVVNASLLPLEGSPEAREFNESSEYSSSDNESSAGNASAAYDGNEGRGEALLGKAPEANASGEASGTSFLSSPVTGFAEFIANPKGQLIAIAILFFAGSALWFFSKRNKHYPASRGESREDEWLR